MVLEFYDSELKSVIRSTSAFSLQAVPRAGELVYLPPSFQGERGGTYKVNNIRYLFWGDPRDSNGTEVQLTSIVIYVTFEKATLGDPIPFE